MKRLTDRISVRLSDKLARSVQAHLSDNDGLTASRLVQRALTDYLSDNPQSDPLPLGVYASDTVGESVSVRLADKHKAAMSEFLACHKSLSPSDVLRRGLLLFVRASKSVPGSSLHAHRAELTESGALVSTSHAALAARRSMLLAVLNMTPAGSFPEFERACLGHLKDMAGPTDMPFAQALAELGQAWEPLLTED